MKQVSIKRNIVFNIFNQIVNVVIPLVITPYLSRVFGADGIGIFSYTTANVTYFTLFSMLGISGYGQREIAINRDDKEAVSKIFWELQIIHFFSFIVCSIVYLLVIIKSENYRSYYIAQYITILSYAFDISWVFQAYERFELIAIRNILAKSLMLISVFLLVRSKEALITYITIVGSFAFISNISLWFGVRKNLSNVTCKQLNIKRHLKGVFIFFIPTIAASVYSVLDKSVINWVTHDDTQNGFYEQAYKILQVCNTFVQTLATVSSPRMSNVFAKGSKVDFESQLNYSLNLMLFISFPVAFGVSGIAKDFIPLFFGSGYDQVISIVYIFMPLVVILGFSVYLDGLYLVPSGKRLQSSFAIIVGSIMNLFLNFYLVSIWKAQGAAIATLLTETLITAIMIVMSKKVIVWKNIFNSFVKYCITSIIMFAIVLMFSKINICSILKLIIQIVTGVLVYFGILTITKDEIVCSIFFLIRKRINIVNIEKRN